MCGYSAGSRGKSVLILEKGRRVGGKIAISGGGKCNFTNMDCGADDLFCSNKHFVKSALARFSQWDFIGMLDDHNIDWEERAHGRLFCQHSAGEIVSMLEELCRTNKVTINCNSQVSNVCKSDSGYTVISNSTEYSCSKVVIACGGSAWPQCGAGEEGYAIARKFELKILPPEPALVPLLYNKDDLEHMGQLSGNAIDTKVSCKQISFSEELLFTHTGLSGPSILQISNLWHKGEIIYINFLPETDMAQKIEQARINAGSTTINKLLWGKLPQKFIRIWQERYWPDTAVANLSSEQIEQAVNSINNWGFEPSATAGMRRAEATRGGVSCEELSSKTFESKSVPGLHFIGEVIDVNGKLGGYNLQWAWSSGYCCGQEL